MDAEERQLEVFTGARATGRADGTGLATALAVTQEAVRRDDTGAGFESHGPKVVRA